MDTILIIDDDISFCRLIEDLAKKQGYQVTKTHTIEDGMMQANQGIFSVVLLDINLPDGHGLDILPDIKKLVYHPEVIILTGEGDPDGAELAIQNGAWDYLEKENSINNLLLPLIRAVNYHQNKSGHKHSVLKRDAIIGTSQKLMDCLDIVAYAAESDTKVLITGETGTGKELFARAIHQNSKRSNENFVVVDCSALPHTLVESVLFGHKRGAFTSANQDHKGLVEEANGGTLMLDEVGELPLEIQKKFLRVLQEQSFRPVGGTKEITSDFRLISATNRDLNAMVQTGDFRSDLLFRISTVRLHLPSLREREDDIKELCLHYVSRFCKKRNISIKGISNEFFDALARYSWPGNTRELVGVIDAALDYAMGESMLLPIHLPVRMRSDLARGSVKGGRNDRTLPPGEPSLDVEPEDIPKYKDLIKKTELEYLHKLLTISRGNINEATELSGISKSRLYEMLKKYHIKRNFS